MESPSARRVTQMYLQAATEKKKPTPNEKAALSAFKWGHITRAQLDKKIGASRAAFLLGESSTAWGGRKANYKDARTPAQMIEYLKENGIFTSGGDVVRIDDDLTYYVDSAKPFRRTGIRLQGKKEFYGGYESFVITITPRQAVIKTKMVEEDWVDENTDKISTIQILGA